MANRELVSAAELALSGVIEERKVGQRTTLDVLNAQADVISAQVDLVSSERDVVVASYAILSAVGHLSARSARARGRRVPSRRALQRRQGQVDRPAGRPTAAEPGLLPTCKSARAMSGMRIGSVIASVRNRLTWPGRSMALRIANAAVDRSSSC